MSQGEYKSLEQVRAILADQGWPEGLLDVMAQSVWQEYCAPCSWLDPADYEWVGI